MLANLMFELPAGQLSTTARASGGLWLGELVATAGLILVIFVLARTGRAALSAASVASYIGAAYWFTSSSSFANPAVTAGRMFSDTFAGIAPGSVPGFVAAQLIGGALGAGLVLVLYPEAGRSAGQAVIPHERSDQQRTDQKLSCVMSPSRQPTELVMTETYHRPDLSIDQRLALKAAANLRDVLDGEPIVLFLCTHNAGRSQMALGFFEHLAGERAVAWSGGSEPANEINPSAVAVMAECGIDISKEYPKPWTDEIVRAADVVITMGCGDACPVFPGKRYLDWDLPDPAGKGVEDVRPVREDIERRVRALVDELVPAR